MLSRRSFIKSAAALSSGVLMSSHLEAFSTNLVKLPPGISCQQYPWLTFFRREGKDWNTDLANSIDQVASVGFGGFEPSFADVKEVATLDPLLKKHNISTGSLYVNSILHEEDQVEESIRQVLEIARAAQPLGVKILVTNPSPIRWGGDEDKTDAQLITQAKALNKLGKKLKEIDLSLAYHTHDAEMRHSAREFHHMLQATNADYVKLCLDAHWIYRGSGDSQVALFDIVDMYTDRIVELHLRQSKGGIWTEDFTEGDIDYTRLASMLNKSKIKPHIVLEQAVEDGTPHTMDGVKAHQLGHEYAREVFSKLL